MCCFQQKHVQQRKNNHLVFVAAIILYHQPLNQCDMQVRGSIALCNIAAASHDERWSSEGLLPVAPVPALAATMLPQSQGEPDCETSKAEASSSEPPGAKREGPDKPIVKARSGSPTPASDADGTVAKSNHRETCWLRSTDILPKIIAAGLVRANGEVRGNLLKAMSNLMCSPETRAEIVNGKRMTSLFELVQGYTGEVRGVRFHEMARRT